MFETNDKTIAVISLGCDKNRVDTERMLFGLTQKGYSITSIFDTADIIVINTCAFIESARKEAIDAILECIKYKEFGKCQKLIVTGCLPQKHIDSLIEGLPEVDAFLGVGAYSRIVDIVDKLWHGERIIDIDVESDNEDLKRFITTPQHYAYLKISDGCNRRCTFCTIPFIRGDYKSREFESVIMEAKGLIKKGAKEIILVAQDTTSYGIDNGSYRFLELINRLTDIDGLEWLRLMYCYPELVDDKLIETIARNNKIVKYIDIPVQHASDKILKDMGRGITKKRIIDLYNDLRSAVSDIAIRSTFIAGFPGETESDYFELKDFIKEYKPTHAGFFAYSREKATASYSYKEQVASKIKKQRVSDLAKIQYNNCIERGKNMIGKTIDVLYEDIDIDMQMFVGRSQYDAPNVDSRVFFNADFVDVGNIYKVKIKSFKDYDLIGEVVYSDL